MIHGDDKTGINKNAAIIATKEARKSDEKP
jgi:hypothetical protein